MATVQIFQPDVGFQGYSSDERPRGPNGATYHVLDTGDVLVAHEGDWIPDIRLARALFIASKINT